ncbi:MAG TPA: fibronectin type III domain-containing protein [Deltaproteobacteria bacterium]|nr:fibronectin type III domain-containing protein [Deltaproteobacteria bacterium]
MRGFAGARIGAFAALLCILPGLVFAAVVRISWNDNTESNLAGYKVYCGTASGSYGSVLNVGRNNRVDISGCQEEQTYYFVVTAYNTSRLESGFSQEASITIPVQPTGFFHTFIRYFISAFEWVFRIDPEVPLYGLDEFAAFSQAPNPVPSSAITVSSSTTPAEPEDAREAAQWGLPVRDVVMDLLGDVDLDALFPGGFYYFLPLDELCPLILEGSLVPCETGCFHYLVYDELGDPAEILRVSVAEEISALQVLKPWSWLDLVDAACGIGVTIPAQGLSFPVPVAVGWGGEDRFPASSLLPQGSTVVEFDLLPYGLILEEPAEIGVLLEGANPRAQRYDEETERWIELEGVGSRDGVVAFSTEVLGRFSVSTSPEPRDKEYDLPGISCFIGSALTGDGSAAWMLALVLGLGIGCFLRLRKI